MSDSRKTEYQAYLASPAWAWLREQVMVRANGQCEMCQKVPAVAVHHVRYPKVFADDHPDNLLALCSNCHEKTHGIRVKVMNEQMIDNAPKVDFVFRGKNNHEYRFEFLVIEGRPWIPICDVERKLYQEDEKNGVERIGVHHGYEQLTPNGRLLAMKAATQLKPEYCMAYKGETWIRASGAMQLITKSDSAAGQAFREQLGDWLESQVMAGQSQTQEALFDAAGVEMGSLTAIQGLLTAMFKHKEAIARVDAKADKAISDSEQAFEIASATRKLVEDIQDVGFMITDEYIRNQDHSLANRTMSARFGLYIAQRLQRSGGVKTENGWMLRGEQVSKTVPWPGMVNQKLNKWNKEKILDVAWPDFVATMRH